MAIAWPDQFPGPLVGNYAITLEDSIIRTDMDSGPARQRRRFTAVPSKVSVSWRMSQSIFGLFESWYKYKTKDGAEWILIDLSNGLGDTLNEARFLRPYKSTFDGVWWTVSAEFEVREMPVISESVLDSILAGGNLDSIFANSDRLHKLINEDLSSIYRW